MAIDALVSGRIYKKPQSRVAASGKRFVTTVVRAAARNEDALFVSVIAFSTSACDALLALEDGDSVALAGELTPKIYTPRDGSEPRPSIDLVAHRVLSEYHVQRKRKAMAEAKSTERTELRGASDAAAGAHREPQEKPEPGFNDAIPF